MPRVNPQGLHQVIVLDDDVILAEIAPGLDLDEFQ
jgi:hypothetical protein